VYGVSRSEAQQRHRERFRLATLYAKRCVAHPETKAEYENIARVTDKWSAFATAVGDYLVPVSVERIDISHFTGRSGSPVFVAVNDRYKVRTIVVTIKSMSGDVIERGHATFVSGNEYVYKTVTSELSDVVVKVEVTDRPGVVVVVETPVESRPGSVDENVRPAQENRLMQAPYTVRSFSFETSAFFLKRKMKQALDAYYRIVQTALSPIRDNRTFPRRTSIRKLKSVLVCKCPNFCKRFCIRQAGHA
jgi:hypothetical protein